MSDSAAEDPIRVVNAVISIKELSKPNEETSPGPEGGEEMAGGVTTGIKLEDANKLHRWLGMLRRHNYSNLSISIPTEFVIYVSLLEQVTPWLHPLCLHDIWKLGQLG